MDTPDEIVEKPFMSQDEAAEAAMNFYTKRNAEADVALENRIRRNLVNGIGMAQDGLGFHNTTTDEKDKP